MLKSHLMCSRVLLINSRRGLWAMNLHELVSGMGTYYHGMLLLPSQGQSFISTHQHEHSLLQDLSNGWEKEGVRELESPWLSLIHQAIPLTLFALIVAAHESVGGIEITSPSTRWALWGSSGRQGGGRGVLGWGMVRVSGWGGVNNKRLGPHAQASAPP